MKQGSGVSYIHGSSGDEHPNPFAATVSKVRDNATHAILRLMHGMFDGIDDSFFELANGAKHNNEQNRYFEAMREVRIKRKGIETFLQQELNRFFTTPPELKPVTSRTATEESNSEPLALVQNDVLEETVAITSMISKARATFTGSLLQFQTRFSYALKLPPEAHKVNPLEPESLCKAFATACGNLDVDIREKLIIYKQFDRYVLGNFDQVLEEGNRLLVHAGVLPHLKHSAAKSAVTPKVSAPARERMVEPSTASTLDAEPENLFPQIQELLGALRASDSTHSHHTSSPHGVTQPLSDQDLLGLLSQLQSARPMENLAEGPAQPIDLRATITRLLQDQAARSGTSSALNEADEDLINLVSMLFDFILDDYNLSAPVQVLISRLQIPILKVVIKDKQFFNKAHHPARKLLNSLAKAGIGWSDISEQKRDKLYEQMHSIVLRILDEFHGDISLFEELHQQFSDFLAREERKASLVEQRTREAEEGRVKSQRAQLLVDQILNEQVQSLRLPAVAVDLLSNGWSRVMFLAYLRDDTAHQWEDTVRVVNDLIWCLQPHSDREDRQRWVQMVPQLLKTLKAGLQEVSYSSSRLDQMLTDLKKELTEAFKQQSSAAADKKTPRPAVPQEPIAKKTAVERQAEIEDAKLAEFLIRIDELQTGTWVEFALVNGSKFRCKLSTRVGDDNCYIFVNRMGLKVVEKTRQELAHEMRRGRLQVLEEGLLLDRAMDAIFNNLKRKAA